MYNENAPPEQNEEIEQNAQQLRKALAHKKYDGLSLNAMIKQMNNLRIAKEEAEDVLKALNDEFDVLRIECIPQKMEDEGVASPYNMEGIGRISLTGDLYVQVKDKSGLYSWLRGKKLGSLITETVNGSTFKAFMRKRIVEGKDMPPEDAVTYQAFTRASITPVKR